MGRPKLAETEARTARVIVRMTAAEAARVDAAAAAAGLDRSEWVRRALLSDGGAVRAVG